MSNDPVDIVSAHLIAARRQRNTADDLACAGLLTTFEQADEVHERVYAALESDQPEGTCARYWKSGGPSRTEPIRHAPLLSEGVRPSGASLADLPLRLRLIEAEVALRLGRDVTADDVRDITQAQALEWVDAMAVTIEVCDSRWQSGRGAAPLLKSADFLMHGALAIGDFVPFAPRDWSQQACHVRIGDQPVQSFVGSLGLGTRRLCCRGGCGM